MTAPVRRRTPGERVRGALTRAVAIADEPGDDDDVRLRKRVGVTAGYLSIVAPLTLPFFADFSPLSVLLAVALPVWGHRWECRPAGAPPRLRSIRHRPDRRRAGVRARRDVRRWRDHGSDRGLPWGFLVPAYAIMALGPSRAAPWFVGYVLSVVAMVVLDPLARASVDPAPYGIVVLSHAINTVVPLAIAFLLLRYTDLRRRAAEARADELLTNAIPRPIANRLKHGEERIADSHPATSVLFADIVGFTPWAQRTPPHEVVALLDGLLAVRRASTAAHGLEKIKTVGDAYMAVAGAPEARDDHAVAAVELARAMIDAVREVREATGVDLHMRVGIASGPVVAGVIGRQRFQFDLWGDTVNLAARMESSGVPDRIQVAASTYSLLADHCAFEPREVDVKGLGPMTAYLVA